MALRIVRWSRAGRPVRGRWGGRSGSWRSHWVSVSSALLHRSCYPVLRSPAPRCRPFLGRALRAAPPRSRGSARAGGRRPGGGAEPRGGTPVARSTRPAPRCSPTCPCAGPARPSAWHRARPRQHCVEEPTARVRRRAGDPVQVDVGAPLVLAPDGGVLVRHGEHAHERVAVEDAEQVARGDLGEDSRVGRRATRRTRAMSRAAGWTRCPPAGRRSSAPRC